jgi:hypothetical protein
MTPTWTQRVLAVVVFGSALICAACGSEDVGDGGLPKTKQATAESVKSDIEKFNSMKPGNYKGAPGAMPKK